LTVLRTLPPRSTTVDLDEPFCEFSTATPEFQGRAPRSSAAARDFAGANTPQRTSVIAIAMAAAFRKGVRRTRLGVIRDRSRLAVFPPAAHRRRRPCAFRAHPPRLYSDPERAASWRWFLWRAGCVCRPLRSLSKR